MGEVLTLPFLGSRSYLQGSTLFEALEPRLEGAQHISFKIAKILRTDRVEIRALQSPGDARFCSATLTFHRSGQQEWLGILPLEPSPLIRREVFDEISVTRDALFGPGTADFPGPSPYPLAKTVTALNKEMLLRTFHLAPEQGQWLFARFDLARLPDQWLPLSLRVKQNVGLKAVLSRIFTSTTDVPVGGLMFSWVER